MQPVLDSIFKYHLSSEDQKKSSTFRELLKLKLKEGLELLAERLRGKRVLWRNDNWAVSLIVQFGSMKAELHDLACAIVELCNMYQIHLKVEWMSRNEKQIQFCDQLSKDFDPSEYRISGKNFERLEDGFGPFRVDMFASDWTHQMVPFFSRYLCPESAGVDAFAQDWSYGNLYCHPPIGQVFRTLRMAEKSGAKGILLIPDWPASINLVGVKMFGQRVQLVDRFRPDFRCPSWWTN